MLAACTEGSLEVAKWLYASGAAKDCRNRDNGGRTPMYVACHNGHLNIARWLYEEAGASEDIYVASTGTTTLAAACSNSGFDVMTWLILKGAANHTAGPWAGHVSVFTLAKEVIKPEARSVLGSNLHKIIDLNRVFTTVFLPGVYATEFALKRSKCGVKSPVCSLRGYESVLIRHIADFLGIHRGRALRNAREAASWIIEDI